ncbi:uncharacterized protein LOC129004898 [Macrosteles quadrilineatus]|uniref:uncharacterized protein LOC129004898 n=1 Tax=Macrosteles quadrilineatus TaxID=74068 RepID=UPI0023E1F15C|nr:uncharacterized protein LOC129004898 [Macrosteles quadrilineatus]
MSTSNPQPAVPPNQPGADFMDDQQFAEVALASEAAVDEVLRQDHTIPADPLRNQMRCPQHSPRPTTAGLSWLHPIGLLLLQPRRFQAAKFLRSSLRTATLIILEIDLTHHPHSLDLRVILHLLSLPQSLLRVVPTDSQVSPSPILLPVRDETVHIVVETTGLTGLYFSDDKGALVHFKQLGCFAINSSG